MSLRSIPVALAPVLLLALVSVDSEVAAQRLPLRPPAIGGYPIIPIMEGWWDNGDGSFTVSFGYVNRNKETLDISIGESNSIEPASFSGMQPTAFLPGRQHGVFTVTFPAEMRETGVLWTIRTNEEVTRVPGRPVASTYQLDRRPRPHGTVPPLLGFEEGGEVGQYPPGIMAPRVETVRVGELLPLTVHVEDLSVRDPSDYRFREPLPVAVSWFKYQGPPGEIEWVRHPSTPIEPPDTTAVAPGGRAARPPSASEIEVPEGKGLAMVQARFPVAGEYMLRVRADQFGSAPDSSAGNQCCWTNGYVRVRVTP